MSKNLSALSGRKGLEENLFEQMGRKAAGQGMLDPGDMEKLAREYLMGDANLFGAASFYDFTREENKGKQVYVCNGSACLAAGTQDAVHHALEKHFPADAIGTMCCLGRCHENSAFFYKDRNYSGKALAHLDEIVSGKNYAVDQYHVGLHGPAVLTRAFGGWEAACRFVASCLREKPEDLLSELKASGLRGRGGAGFPTGIKLESCRNSPGKMKFVVCNGDEGDPAAFSDRYLLEQRPEFLLLGMLLAGYMIGGNWGVVYVRGEYPEVFPILEQKIQEMQSAGLLGTNILDSGFDFHFKVIRAQGAYICGEETALLNSIEGQRPEVRTRPPFPSVQGLFNQPTIVNNVESLASIPWILENGGATYAAIGPSNSTGTKLLSLDSFFNRPGIYEVEKGTPLRFVLEELGQGFRAPVKALHIGGPLGGLVPMHKVDELRIDYDNFAKNGFLLGHGSVLCIPANFSLVEYVQHLFQFTAHESCGKCFPCRLGSTRGSELLDRALHSDYKIDPVLFRDLLDTMQSGSLCALGGGLPLPVKNALQYFPEEFEPYFAQNPVQIAS
ncbi:MAG: NAD(P)H-dependent oxidoreductase subunit E [Bacteroidetes bacterium]|nr:NAD(P)H-dependent oxidoreductase subunit E [Bacteroidota bacterium]